jgi:hypothetical protein
VTNLLAEANEIQGDLVAIRRHIHQEPEIGLDLPKAQAKILAAYIFYIGRHFRVHLSKNMGIFSCPNRDEFDENH